MELLDIMCQNPDVTLRTCSTEGGSDGGCTFLSTPATAPPPATMRLSPVHHLGSAVTPERACTQAHS
ncbi:MAG: hypothetical protein ACLTKG_05035 [Collinsella intestinalis]